MQWPRILQWGIVVAGLYFGVHFSKISYQQHQALSHHSGLQDHKEMDHGTFDVSLEHQIPEITNLLVEKDPMSGWNLKLETKNFKFAPEHASQEHIPGEGHAHVYLNGKKVGRLYNHWMHLPEFTISENVIKVTLNTNDHKTLTKGEVVIERIVKL